MAQKGADPGQGRLEALAAAAQGQNGLPPVHLWNPPLCADIGLKIARDGSWWHQGAPIGRPALVKLFASVLRHDPDVCLIGEIRDQEKSTVKISSFVPILMTKCRSMATIRCVLKRARPAASNPM